MVRLIDSVLDAAARFLWASGRVLDQRRFEVLFAGATDRTGLLCALDAYRTAEGAYAYGLEPDVRGPAPQPISVPSALEVLAEAGALDDNAARPVVDWLTGVTGSDGGVPAVLPTLRPYPRPPWLPVADSPAGSLLATGQIAGPLLRARISHPWLKGASEFCHSAVGAVQDTHPYDVESALRFIDATDDRVWAHREAARLGTLVRDQRIVLLDPARPEDAVLSPGYAPGEYHLPYDYARRPDSLARGWFSDAEMDRALDHLVALQQEDGGWPIRWAVWSPTSAAEARPGVTIDALRILQAYDEG